MLHKILHDADCLDIIRARDKFDASYLDFYKDFVKKDVDSCKANKTLPKSLIEMGQFIAEVRSLIEYSGDTRHFTLEKIRKDYKQKDCYTKILKCIKGNRFPLMNFFLNNNEPSMKSFDQIDGISYRQPQDKFNVFRGINIPSGVNEEYHRFDSTFLTAALGNTCSSVNIELSFDFMDELNGPRSVSLLDKSGLFSASGFVCSNQELDSFSNVYSKGNASTGFGKKQVVSQSPQQKMDAMYNLMLEQCMGGWYTEINGHTQSF